MIEIWRFGGHRLGILIVLGCLLCQNLGFCWSLNDEGLALLRFREGVVSNPFGALSDWNDDIGVIDPCSWSGVECWDGNVIILNLKDLCLGGRLAPDLGNLVHLKSIILRNNSFHGIIPEVIGELKELELLDLGYNNFSGPLPSDLGTNQSLTILLLDNNELFGTMYPEIHELKTFSAVQVDDCLLSNSAQKSSCSGRSISWNGAQTGDAAHRKLLEKPASNNKPASDAPTKRHKSSLTDHAPSPSPLPSSSPSPSPSPSPSSKLKAPSSSASPSPKSEAPYFAPLSPASSTAPTAHASPHSLNAPMLSPVETPNISAKSSNSNRRRALILSAAIGGPMLLFALVIGIFFCRGHKVVVVRPWATGLSGQLQKAFVTGVPSLKRSELEAACEDFSNVIGSSSIGSVYKGTLSNGVEIAVTSIAVTSAKDWSNNLEVQFRNKIDSLSKVNHKNFVNLLGYCEEAVPFTRMLVFEYAPNGTLFEHLHIKEAEHLDWGTRMRITMGIAYCLEHMHQLKPRIAHKNLNSLAINLTEDYASKVSDFGFWSEVSSAAEMESNHESNVYSFGVMLFETVTGRLPYSVDSGSIEDWASDYLRGDRLLIEMVDPTLESFEEQQLRGDRPLREMVDPTLKSFEEQQLEQIREVIKSCVHPNPKRRPTMREVTARLREITGIGPDGAVPKRSPLWWAELEILSTEAS